MDTSTASSSSSSSSSLSVSASCAATACSNSEESTLQALFAEQTAREMAEVVAWWKNKSEEKNDDGDDYTANHYYCGECVDVDDTDGATADSGEITGITPDHEKDGEGNSPSGRMDVDQKHCLPNNSLLMDDDENDEVSYQLFQQELTIEQEASVSCSCPVLDETMEASSSCSMSSTSSSSFDEVKNSTPPLHVHVIRARPSSSLVAGGAADTATEASIIAHIIQNTLGSSSSNTAHDDDDNDDCDVSTLPMSHHHHHSPSMILRNNNNELLFKLHSMAVSPTLSLSSSSSSSSSSDNDTVGWSNCSMHSKNDACVPLQRQRRRRLCRINRQLLLLVIIAVAAASSFIIGVTIGILMMTTTTSSRHHHHWRIQEQLAVGLPPPSPAISPEPYYYRYRRCNEDNELLRFEKNENPDNDSKVDRFLTKIRTLA